MRKTVTIWGMVVAVGIVNALVFIAFEFSVNHGTQWLWNDVVQSDVHRWRVVILAVALAACHGTVLRLLRQPAVPPPATDPVHPEMSDEPATFSYLVTVLLVGLLSLLAGASLGPEASLMVFSTSLGLWVAMNLKNHAAAEHLVPASVGALLVALLGSMVMALVPLVELAKRKQLQVSTVVAVLLACLSSYGTAWLFHHPVQGWGTIPIGARYEIKDLGTGLVVGLAAVGLGWALKRIIHSLAKVTHWIDTSWHWLAASATFGLVLGLLYWIGGETVQFSGSRGSVAVLRDAPVYGFWTLVIMLTAKLLATGWSIVAGYRGGLIFPVVYGGIVALLLANTTFADSGPGVVIGVVAGIFGAMAGPIIALIFMTALVPFKLLPVVLVSIAGTAVGNKLIAPRDK
jgi:H+/Cl- antiporter ClcA